ncbi:bifunctional diaminohydroxyphosphoribosylaminopyrimidine deaminase/5-amino-6-(5-phosphoribosylamino)uracil reductase RibD [Candidatus Providencia siddallii]|uniref:Riboflavin biosynthesis protein RibD n=1 Tax=Candidatus Providencia siddallii TaxID=1715285 RepID=A0ABP1CE18_9GAMM
MYKDQFYMNRALEIAQKGRFTVTPNPNVGCVIVKNNVIVGEGFHQKTGNAHAEILALEMAKEKAKNATVYVTLEPCSHYGHTPPCAKALIKAGVSRVVVAMKDPNPKVSGMGINMLLKAGLKIKKNVFLKKAETINRGFIKRMRTGIPYIRLKLACSLDGKIALKSGKSKWITCIDSRKDVQKLRSESCAILTTSKTVIIDNPSLTVRWHELPLNIKEDYKEKQLRQPIRIVLDKKNLITPNHKITQLEGKCLLIRSCLHNDIKWKGDVEEVFFNFEYQYNNLINLMIKLGSKKINTILVESGSKFATSLIKFNLFDELIIYIAPKFFGKDACNLVDFSGINIISDAPKFKFSNIKKIGNDLRITIYNKK